MLSAPRGYPRVLHRHGGISAAGGGGNARRDGSGVGLRVVRAAEGRQHRAFDSDRRGSEGVDRGRGLAGERSESRRGRCAVFVFV